MKPGHLRNTIVSCCCLLLFQQQTRGQCLQGKLVQDSIASVEADESLSGTAKLVKLRNLSKCRLCPQDAQLSKAAILYAIARLEFAVEKNYLQAMQHTQESVRLNVANGSAAGLTAAANGYYRLADYYYKLGLYKNAMTYYDTAMLTAQRPGVNAQAIVAKSATFKSYIYFQRGDYQRCIEETSACTRLPGLKQDTAAYLGLLYLLAQAYVYQDKSAEAKPIALAMIAMSRASGKLSRLGAAYKILADAETANRNYETAITYFNQSIAIRTKAGDNSMVAADYSDLGNFYTNELKQYRRAERCYYQSVHHGVLARDTANIVTAYINLGNAAYYEGNLTASAAHVATAAFLLGITKGRQLSEPPAFSRLKMVADKETVLILMHNKTELLLQLFKKYKQPAYLNACISNARITDSFITHMRHEQQGEQSKLYWRNNTRDFYKVSIEASFEAGNGALMYYFMEKSRAVLLNDKMNELGASALLPESESIKEQALLLDMLGKQQNMMELTATPEVYGQAERQWLAAKRSFEAYTKRLEQQFPVYYQYKYADSVPPLAGLQKQLHAQGQSLAEYFVTDSVIYVLAVKPGAVSMLKVSQTEFDPAQLSRFMQLIASKSLLNNSYHEFARLGCNIYRKLFEPLAMTSKRIVICPDHLLVPFEALVKDTSGQHYLLQDYAFSYVYSARNLLRKQEFATSRGDFIGFAPVSFPSLKMAELKPSASSLERLAGNYHSSRLFMNDHASKENFLHNIAGYAVATVFSHARADTTDEQPVLFMHDSIINLAELQLLQRPATQLVVLSACQTNVGKNAAGEGIYSLARGFAAAGIPAVSATQWKADEQTIYAISEKFNELLAAGMAKDVALHEARLWFVNNNTGEKLLPYYWANMVLIGNSEPIHFAPTYQNRWLLLILLPTLLLLLFAAQAYRKYRRKHVKQVR